MPLLPLARTGPRVFISSTIYDFADLRSALKYYFEELGFHVDESEQPDFERSAHANSYDACLNAIRRSDLFILLIGGRLGGWYNLDKRVTITQQEYKVAYESAKSGKPNIAVLVRKTTATALHALKSAGPLGTDKIDGIDDPQHLDSFLNEVRRIDEMKAGMAEDSDRPPANWLTHFDSFRDVIGVMESVFLTGNVASQVTLEMAAQEVADAAKRLTVKAVPCETWSRRPSIPVSAVSGCRSVKSWTLLLVQEEYAF